MSRNHDIDTTCTICNLPFSLKEEGHEKEIAGVPVNLCGKCWGAMIGAVEENEPHLYVTCPHCEEEIGVRVETINES